VVISSKTYIKTIIRRNNITMKYYEIVLYSTHQVQRIPGIPEDEAMRFKAWLLNDKASNAYEFTFEKSLYNSDTQCSIIFKNNLLNVDLDILRE
jgi:hypothetical protein